MPIVALMMVVTVADQFTKHVIWSSFRLGEFRSVVPGLLNLRYIRNDGAAWGLFAGLRWPLVAVSAGMLAMLYVHRRELVGMGRLGRWAMGLLLGGIVGNLIDRLRFGYVVDFVDVHVRQSHFPAFNIADAAICVGVALYMLATVAGAMGSRLPTRDDASHAEPH